MQLREHFDESILVVLVLHCFRAQQSYQVQGKDETFISTEQVFFRVLFS
jgi:hypothetical protein